MPNIARIPAGPRVREWARQNRFSEWMVARWVRLVDDPLPFLDGLLKRPPKYVRVNPLQATVPDVRQRLTRRDFAVNLAPLDDHVLRIDRWPMSPGATFEHMLGMTSPQDLASSSAPIALGARAGETIADIAAAPGMKTIHVAGRMEDTGNIVAVEPDAQRMEALAANLARCHVSNTVLRNETAQELPGGSWADRVMLDAPCTGEGTVAKDRNRRTGDISEIQRLVEVQQQLVDAADRVLKPGGTLVYATCTFAPEENEGQVQRLLDRGYTMERLPFDACGAPLLPGVTDWPGLKLSDDVAMARRFLPGIHPTLGFFVAKLHKPETP